MRLRSLQLLAAPALLAAAACATDDVIGIDPGATAGSFTVNAAAGWVYVSLSDSAVVTPVPSAGESANWDLAFFATNVTTNGGQAGPGGVTAACICQNATATGEEVLAMTSESERPDFEAVTSVPPGAAFESDVLTPAITGWYTGTGAGAAADTTKSWLVRLADSTSFALLRVRGINGANASNPGIVTLEYRLQTSAAAALGPVQTFDVLSSAGIQRVDLNAGTLSSNATAWDIAVDGFNIRVNTGISGAGKAGAATNAAAFAATTTAVTAANAYRPDAYAGVFGSSRFFRYNIAGDHRISPTFDVYLIRRGSRTYKLQITGYYNETGQSRQITFRWAELD